MGLFFDDIKESSSLKVFACSDGDKHTENDDAQGDDPLMNGLDSFLDECDDELEEDDMGDDGDESDNEEDMDDLYYSSTMVGPSIGDSVCCKQKILTQDLQALDAMVKSLSGLKLRYSENPLAAFYHCNQSNSTEKNHAFWTSLKSEDQYCAILVSSELQTIDFYVAAAEIVKSRLKNVEQATPKVDSHYLSSQQMPINSESVKEKYLFDKDDIAWNNIHTLVDAFFSIRYPHLLKNT